MSKLPKAPLVEVVFELRWEIAEKADLMQVEYLYGDIYAELKDKYPYRERILPIEIPVDLTVNKPVFRYRANKNSYPLIQLGPGLITLNTVDKLYYWESFFNDAEELIHAFLKVFNVREKRSIQPSLLYLDFFPFSFKTHDALQFVNQNLNITIKQSFLDQVDQPKDINIGIAYEIDMGDLRVSLQKGSNKMKKEGILMQSRINGKAIEPTLQQIKGWLNESHDICSTLFKNLTKGQLYESFK